MGNKYKSPRVKGGACGRRDALIFLRWCVSVFCAALLATTFAETSAIAGSWTVLSDNQFYTADAFGAYSSPWGAGSLVEGTNFVDKIDLLPASFPNTTVISWNWPATPCQSVCGFLQLSYGDYDDTKPNIPIPSQQVQLIDKLVVEHDISFSGGASGFDAIYDAFLTSTPQGSESFELEIFLHTPTYSASYVNSATQLGTLKDDGQVWRVAVTQSTPADILLMPVNELDIVHARINFKKIFSYLISKHVLTGEEYFNGFAIGIEPRQGKGTMRVHSFNVKYLPSVPLAQQAPSQPHVSSVIKAPVVLSSR
jgi:hypothetical protein